MAECRYLNIHVTPRSGRDELSGLEVGADGLVELRMRVTAPPDDGKANKAACQLVAKSLGIPKSSVSVAAGATSRHKRLAIAAEVDLDAWLAGFRF